ncbi:MAG: dihydrodipicolinate synthase family protein [Clostridia bacterium]|jgi:4-hydroxy-tetrahydrodipicolinate synthase|nr:dihydrodipicolinate synthase family protein [Spirochaetia bacterium]
MSAHQDKTGATPGTATHQKPGTKRLSGVMAPVLTPLRADLSPDVQRWVAFAKSLLADGCTALAPFGTTSEANSIGLEERMDLLEKLVAAGVPASTLLPGTGTCAITDTVKLTAQAARLGCAGVLLLPPFYYKGVSDEGVFRATAEVIERTGSSDLRVYVYHIPPVAVVGYSLAVIERLLKTYPDTVVGMKDSCGDWAYQESVLKAFPGFTVFSGTEKFLTLNQRHGGAGTISAMANVIPAKIRAVYDKLAGQATPGSPIAPDDQSTTAADQRQAQLDQYRASLGDCAAIPAIKELVAARTGENSWRTVCPPLVPLSPQQAEGLHTRFNALPK